MNVFTLEKTHDIKLLMVDHEQRLLSQNNFELTYNLITEVQNSDEIEEAQIQQNLSFAKINMMIKGLIDNSVVIEFGENVASTIEFLAKFDNNLMVLPELHESSIISALHCKFNTISGPHTFVEEVRLKNLEDNITYRLFCDEDDPYYSQLPSEEEWLGEFSYWDKPWWYRNDGTMLDRNAVNEEEYQKWLEARAESGLDDGHGLFEEIEEYIRNGIPVEGIGEVVEVDFSKNKWEPRLVE